ncbi:transketolase family protein [Neorhizobium galegae]|uniref:Transketolase, pyridine binding domain protein n=1 Tax=Neorhizobium galegae bv. officinalis TaxID=323656 RepID=A0A0T7GKK2_NEOGA|nr:transketolase C-terminal domain-containing protein [Neorhizobium galegae]CDZ47812.1 Transketolase, pyridine binding domain protein [Neorhizobium galegae bv. officinalis]
MSTKEIRESLEVLDFNARGTAAASAAKHYGEALLEAAQRDTRIVCLTADLTLPTETDLFRDHIPERFHQVGIAEANMIGIAGGMARCGEIPFVHSFCVFATRRCYDQVAMQVAYPRANVKVVGVIPGLTTMLGVSHQAIDDVALMRALPNMVVVEPSGPAQVRAAVAAIAAYNGPVYLRLKRADGTEKPTEAASDFHIGRMRVLRTGKSGLVVACGMMVDIALEAAGSLDGEGIDVTVVDMSTIKPIDPALIDLARQMPLVVTAENHSIIGGLGSAVAELLMENDVHVKFRRIGVRDVFAEGGTTPYLFEKYGLSAKALAATIREAAKGKA